MRERMTALRSFGRNGVSQIELAAPVARDASMCMAGQCPVTSKQRGLVLSTFNSRLNGTSARPDHRLPAPSSTASGDEPRPRMPKPRGPQTAQPTNPSSTKPTSFPRRVSFLADRAPAALHEASRVVPVFRDCAVLIVGGGSSGTAAAIAAARTGADVVLPEGYNHLGGLSTGGLVIWIDRMTGWAAPHPRHCQRFAGLPADRRHRRPAAWAVGQRGRSDGGITGRSESPPTTASLAGRNH